MVTLAIDTKANKAVDIIGDEADVPCATFQRVERGLGIQPQILIHKIELRQQRLVALRRRHGGIAAGVKANLGAGLWRRCRNDGLHLLADPRTLVFG